MRAPRSLLREGVLSLNHGRSRSDRCLGRTESLDRTISSEPEVDDGKAFPRERNGARFRVRAVVCNKTLDAADGFIDVYSVVCAFCRHLTRVSLFVATLGSSSYARLSPARLRIVPGYPHLQSPADRR